MSPSDELAIYLPIAAVSPPENPYGRMIANAGTYRALARYGGFRRIHVQSREPADPAFLAAELEVDQDLITTGPVIGTAAAARAGVLLSGQPYLEPPLWARRHAGRDREYSVVGTIFAFASAPHRQKMLQSSLAPLRSWDAQICSSPTLRSTVAQTLDTWEDHLREQLGTDALHLPRPQLPVIPFGCDVEKVAAQAADAQARSRMRSSLGIADDAVMIYYLGRLSYYDKAFPQAMFKAVELAARISGQPTHFVMTGWFPGGDTDRERYEQAAREYAPTIGVTFLDGNDADVVAQCWAAADIFFQLSDTILETFGQALVEAMSAGLPLVVSDWDGFRSIVRDGQEGFLVPTLGAPPGPLGQALALLEELEVTNYPHYAGTAAAHTAASVPVAAQALAELSGSAQLRRTMGERGRIRAFETFAWPVVTEQYLALFAELAERRADAPAHVGRHRMNPLRNDPFVDFAGLPTAVLDDDLVVRSAGTGVLTAGLELDDVFPGVRADPEETRLIREALAEPITVRELVNRFPARRRPFIRMTVMWLAKAGEAEWLPPGR